MYCILIIIYHDCLNRMSRDQELVTPSPEFIQNIIGLCSSTNLFIPDCAPLTPKEEEELVNLCNSTPSPSTEFMEYIIELCSLTNLFIPDCAPFLRGWLRAVACDDIANARTGANDDTSPMSRALQPIYEWRLFMLLGGYLLLSKRKPTEVELCLLEALTTDLGISKGHRDLTRAFISVHSGDALVNPSLLVIIFILQARKRNGVKGCMNAVLVKSTLNAIMTMFIDGCITLYELREYMMILRTCESSSFSRNQCTDAIITLLTGLYDGETSPADMNSIIGMLIEYVTANRPGANIEGALLALHIVPKIPTKNDALRVVQQEDATTLAVDHDHCHIGTYLKVSCDRTRRDYEALFRQIGQSHMDAMYKKYALMKRHAQL